MLVAVLAVAGCGGGSSKENDETSAQPTAAATDPPPGKVTVTGPLGSKPTIKVTPDNPTPPGQLVKVDLHKGKGPAAKTGDKVTRAVRRLALSRQHGVRQLVGPREGRSRSSSARGRSSRAGTRA